MTNNQKTNSHQTEVQARSALQPKAFGLQPNKKLKSPGDLMLRRQTHHAI